MWNVALQGWILAQISWFRLILSQYQIAIDWKIDIFTHPNCSIQWRDLQRLKPGSDYKSLEIPKSMFRSNYTTICPVFYIFSSLWCAHNTTECRWGALIIRSVFREGAAEVWNFYSWNPKREVEMWEVTTVQIGAACCYYHVGTILCRRNKDKKAESQSTAERMAGKMQTARIACFAESKKRESIKFKLWCNINLLPFLHEPFHIQCVLGSMVLPGTITNS